MIARVGVFLSLSQMNCSGIIQHKSIINPEKGVFTMAKKICLPFAACLLTCAMSFPVFAQPSSSCPPSIPGIKNNLVTKAQPHEENDKNPIYVPESGGTAFQEQIPPGCVPKKIHWTFDAAHYANDRGSGQVKIELYSGDQLIDDKSIPITENISSWKDLNNTTLMNHGQETFDVKGKRVTNLKIMVIPGNWGVKIMNMKFRIE